MTEERGDRDVDIVQGKSTPVPTGDDVVGPGTVRRGSGYSGTTSGDIPTGTGHDPSPYDPATAGYMGGTTSEDEPRTEEIIELNPGNEG